MRVVSFRDPLSARNPIALIALACAAAWLSLFLGSVEAAPVLHQISSTVYQTEHCLFIIDSSIPWSSSSAAYSALYSPSGGTFPNLAGYFDTLTTNFPGTYFSVCYMANTGASNVPNYIDNIYKASGINEPGTQGAAQSFSTVDVCRYNLQGNLFTPVIAVYDHELGHAWGAQVFHTLSGPALSNGHWLANSTVDCQLSATYSGDGGASVNKLYGDPTNGFRWQKVDNLRSNDYSTFSEQELYLMGVAERFPTSYTLNGVSYNSDGTASYSSLDTFTHASLVATYGARNPDYTSSSKRFKLGFIYVARDLAEVNSVYQAIERSVDQFCNGESIDTHNYRFQVPFVADARFRASVDGLLSDLDGNSTPTLTVGSAYSVSSDGSATVGFTASDPDGTTPSVSLVQGSNCAGVVGSSVQLSNLPDGVFFFTLKAEDGGGKKTFAHFVVEVQRAAGGPTITTQPLTQTVTAGTTANFTLSASGSPTAYQWYRQPARTSTWDRLSNGGAYSGATTATLSVATDTSMNEDRFLCLVSSGSGTTTSGAAQLRANETTPVFTVQPNDISAPSGNSTPFTVAVGGSTTFGYFTYQWQRQAAGTSSWSNLSDGGAYSSTTTASMRVVSAASMNGDKFRCVVTNTAGSSTSNVATLSSGVAPSITVHPSPVSVTAGQSASFTVVASGTAPLSYQWYRYGVAVTGATSSTLTLSNAQSADAGAYTVTVTNSFGSMGSNVGSLTVNSAAPSISSHPQSTSATVDQSVSLSVTASGSNPLSYQWRKGGAPVAGATSATLTFNSISLSDAGSYDVVVTNSSGSATSSSATLTVNAGNTAPTFTTQPASQSVTQGSGVTFTAAANGSPAPSYQWKKNGGNISGATSASYSINVASTSDAGNYTVVATNVAGSVTSNTASLVVNVPAIAPSISTHPLSTTATAGTGATFSVSASGTAPLTYQWSKNGNAIAGATSSTFSLGSAQLTDAGNYTVTVSNTAGSVVSSVATLTVTAAPTAPSITTQPQNLTATTGTGATFTVVASGTAPLTYQWKKNGASISGATSSSFSIASVGNSDAADYSVVVSNSAGSITSSSATLTVTAAATAPSITSQPQSVAVTVGNTVNFNVVSTGSVPLSYQWKKNGSNLSGATSATLTLSNVQIADAGDYTVVVSNSAGSATSASAALTVNPTLSAPSIGTAPQNISANANTSASFTVVANGSAPLSYQWTKNGSAIPGATSSTLTFNAVQTSDEASYAVIVSNTIGTVTSSSATLTVISSNSAPVITSQPKAAAMAIGGNATLSVTAVGSNPLTYQWYVNGGAIGGANQSTYAIANARPEDAGDYVVVVSNTLGITASTSVPVSVVDASNTGHLINLSVRGLAGTDAQTLIVGFIVSGNGELPVLVRGWGPTLGKDPFNVPGILADPLLRVFRGSTQVGQNDNWSGDAQITAVTAQVGAYPFSPTSKDAAIYTNFGGSANTVHILGLNTGIGVALAEVFDATPVFTAASPHFVNLSARAQVGTGGDVLIAGFVVGGQTPITVAIRALGPALTAFGVSGVLNDPTIELHDATKTIAVNDNWSSSTNATQIAAVNTQLGLPLPSGSKDAVIIATLPPGLYSVVVSGVNNTTGVALIDVSEIQ